MGTILYFLRAGYSSKPPEGILSHKPFPLIMIFGGMKSDSFELNASVWRDPWYDEPVQFGTGIIFEGQCPRKEAFVHPNSSQEVRP